ncbi:MAG: serine/threonine protein kinase [Comamonadaceae bacterium]|nr:serine/threonine protein kinase [Comamonadaceae bacterium]
MGEVYLAENPHLPGKRYAVKVLRQDLSAVPRYAELLAAEARRQARLEHENIVQLYDFFPWQQRYCLIAAYVDGTTLAEIIDATPGGLPEARALDLMLDVLEGLNYAHQQGVLHRDVKPPNVLVDREHRVRVTDFGIARDVGLGCQRGAVGRRGNAGVHEPGTGDRPRPRRSPCRRLRRRRAAVRAADRPAALLHDRAGRPGAIRNSPRRRPTCARRARNWRRSWRASSPRRCSATAARASRACRPSRRSAPTAPGSAGAAPGCRRSSRWRWSSAAGPAAPICGRSACANARRRRAAWPSSARAKPSPPTSARRCCSSARCAARPGAWPRARPRSRPRCRQASATSKSAGGRSANCGATSPTPSAATARPSRG